jgi:O-antigen/teichoic acid export membrane protein
MHDVAPPQPESLRRNFSMTAIGNLVYAGCQFGMLSILARSSSTVEVGRYALALAITGPVFIFANLKLRQVLATDATGEFTFGEYLGQRILTSIISSICLGVGAYLVGLSGRSIWTLLAVTAFKAFESVIDILYGALQRFEQMSAIARSQIWRGIGGVVAFGITAAFTKRADAAAGALALYTVPQIMTNVWRVRRIGVSTRPSYAKASQLRLTWIALPLGVAVSAGALATNVPRYFMQHFEGTAALGVFAALAYILTMSSTIIGALGQSASPRLANLFAAANYGEFRRILRRLIFIAITLGLLGILASLTAGKPVLRIVFGLQYAKHVDVLVVLMLAAAIQYGVVFLGTAVNAMRRFAVQMPISVLGVIAVAGVSALLIPRYGLMGGALSVLTGQAVTAACYVFLLVRVILPETRPRRPDTYSQPLLLGDQAHRCEQ